MKPPLPRMASPFLAPDKPLTSRQLVAIRQVLAATYQIEKEDNPSEKAAAVLIPLCNVNARPGVLFEVRGKLRHHPGEVRSEPDLRAHIYTKRSTYIASLEARLIRSAECIYSDAKCANGYHDQTDPTTLFTALRETNEELGINPQQIEVLGRIGPSTISLSGLRVYPYVVCRLSIIDPHYL